jgi:4-amino-4-deoxy-L-arabinose transferase-like glycosyltransferase
MFFMKWWVGAILLLAVFLRLYNLSGNFNMGNDGARDVMIAREAIARGELPLTGPFTSAGPFVFGPIFYWFVIFAYLFLPLGLFSPWVLMLVVGTIFVGVMMAIGYQLGDKKLMIIVGLLAATSPQMIARSRVLTQHTLIAVTGALAIFCLVLLWKKKKTLLAFLLGLSLGSAVSLHYQALNLLIFLPVTLLIPAVSWKKRTLFLAVSFTGFLLPLLPLLWWDSKQDFASLNNLLDFFLIGQYRFYVPMSWKLFLFQQFPAYFSYVSGGFLPVGLVLFFASTAAIIFHRKAGLMLSVIFLILLIANRYYHGERFEGYLIYLAPLVILLTGLLFQKLPILFLVPIIFLNIWVAKQVLVTIPNNQTAIQKFAMETKHNYPGQKISLYQNSQNSSEVNGPLYLTLKEMGVISTSGYPLGVYMDCATNYHLVDLSAGTDGWQQIDQAAVYDDLIGWLQKHQLKSTFSLTKYIQDKITK